MSNKEQYKESNTQQQQQKSHDYKVVYSGQDDGKDNQ